ncbi:hypothetical protein SAMN05216282_10675 [Cryobacterium psychrotolerans]|uniref:Uncharacterized protein n=2 Tax=Microbacteriaceae TaxID=85023 RepID=A0A1G9BYP6_9MICO|nr:hypothetical protein SAMN05216282_10675 [Cryobacterium psychrotolerans]
MCGACGRRTVQDPILGNVRTMRQQIIVAQVINAVCRHVPGVPRVTALVDNWLMAGPTGATKLCDTVEELWTAIIDGSVDPNVPALSEALKAYSADPLNTGLAAQVTELGLTLAEGHAHRHRAGHPPPP